MYGLDNKAPVKMLATMVCNVLGNGVNSTAVALMVETSCAETLMGKFEDQTPNGAGRGLCQVDPIGFIDVVQRTRDHHKVKTLLNLGYDLDKCSHTDLDNDPVLALIFCRLHYKLKPEVIPASLVGRAQYWKKHYNTVAGKGTIEHYIKMVKKCQMGES